MDAAPASSRFRIVLGTVVSAALLVPLAVYGAPALAKSAAHQYGPVCGQYGSSGGQYGSSDGEYGSACGQYRVHICHRTHSKKHPWRIITVSNRAVKAHLRHGDTLPPCPLLPAAKNGKGHGHGHGKPGDAGSKHNHH